MKAPIRGSGPSSLIIVQLALVRPRDLVLTVTQVVHVAEHWRSGWQVRLQREQIVERILPVWRIVNQVAALESPGGIRVPVKADQRSFVEELRLRGRPWRQPSPVFKEPQEIVDTAVHTERKLRVLRRVQERDRFAPGNRHSIVGVNRNP